MKKERKQIAKKIMLNMLSVSLLALLTIPIFILVTEGIGIVLGGAISFSVISAYLLTYGVTAFSTYRLSRNIFNFFKDEIIIGHKSIKRKMKNICKMIDTLENTDDTYKKNKTLDCVNTLIEDEQNILEKADEAIEVLAKLSKNNVLELLLVEESKDVIIKNMVQLQNLKQRYVERIQKWHEINEEYKNGEKSKERNFKKEIEKGKDRNGEKSKEMERKDGIEQEEVRRGGNKNEKSLGK